MYSPDKIHRPMNDIFQSCLKPVGYLADYVAPPVVRSGTLAIVAESWFPLLTR